MKFILRKSSDWEFRDEIEINTLEELVKYQKDLDCEIVLGSYTQEDEPDEPDVFYIEIYNGYRE